MGSTYLGSRLRSFLRLAGYAALTLPMMPIQFVSVAFNLPLRATLPLWYHRRCARIVGIRVESRGRRSRQQPTLFVANHVSYLDIMVLGGLIPASFVAKAEVRSWPLFGWLARLQRTVFIERRGTRSRDHLDSLSRRLEAGDNLILFAEGTSSDGNRVLPFKSALFAVADLTPKGAPLTVQPVSIAYTALDGMPMGRYFRPFYAWYGDMALAGHLWRALGLGRATVKVEFHPPMTLAEAGSRKALAEAAQARVAAGVAAALSGRRLPSRGPAIPDPAQEALEAGDAQPEIEPQRGPA